MHYFTVTSPFRIWRHVGTWPSKATLFEFESLQRSLVAENAKPGDSIHVLAEETYLVRDGECHPISLAPPKCRFETKHQETSAAELMLQNVGRRRAVFIAKEMAVRPDYAAATKRIMENETTDDDAVQVVVLEMSPELELAWQIVEPCLTALRENGVEHRKIGSDATHTGSGSPRVMVGVGDEWFMVTVSPVGIMVKIKEADSTGELNSQGVGDGYKNYCFGDPSTSMDEAREVIFAMVEGLIADVSAPRA